MVRISVYGKLTPSIVQTLLIAGNLLRESENFQFTIDAKCQCYQTAAHV